MLFRKKRPLDLKKSEIMPKEEYTKIMLQIVNLAQTRERGEIDSDTVNARVLAVVVEALDRFTPEVIRSNLDTARQIEGPISLVIDSSPFTKQPTSYAGGDGLKDILVDLIFADQNLYMYSELHRQAADTLQNLGKFDEALAHYLTAVQSRPCYSYILDKGEVVTPPDLEGFGWPKVKERGSGVEQNSRVMGANPVPYLRDARSWVFLYARLGKCLRELRDFRMAGEAFKVCSWFLERLRPDGKEGLIATVIFERGMLSFERSDHDRAIADFEKARDLWSIGHNERALIEDLLRLSESYSKTGRNLSARDCLSHALEIATIIGDQAYINSIKQMLSDIGA
jgi:tetratricopeptide (TPR) repeat protein